MVDFTFLVMGSRATSSRAAHDFDLYIQLVCGLLVIASRSTKLPSSKGTNSRTTKHSEEKCLKVVDLVTRP
eukprot:2417468-Amphidinium_carterae.1